MSVEFGWRRFYFFDKNFVNDPNAADKFTGLKDVSANSWCSVEDAVYLGVRSGGIFRLNANLDICYWKAFHRSQKEDQRPTTALTDIKCTQNYLFSVGEDDDTGPLLKMWAKIADDEPELKKTVRLGYIFPGQPSQVTAVGVSSHLTDVVAGFADGTVIIYQGDIARDKMTRGWIRIREASLTEGSVEGLAVAHLPGDSVVVFVILAKALYSYVVDGSGKVLNQANHNFNGAMRDCWSFNERLGQLAVTNKEMVCLFDAERSMETDGGQGRTYPLARGHEKLQCLWFGEYLVLLTKQQALITAGEKYMSVVTIYDIKGQYIAFSCSLPAICRMFILDGVLMVVSEKDGALSELKEKNLTAKLDILFKKKFFDVALNLAKSSKDGQSHLQTIHLKYGDHLYSKGDFDNAINQYKETIGLLEPSYVMKRFHDENRLQQLCIYLEALHDRRVHNGHQTEILLKTYARLGEKAKLLTFVEKMASIEDADMIKAFKTLRDAKLSREASLLAMKLHLHKEAVAVFVEDLQKYPTAVKYLKQQTLEISSPLVEQYGRTLLEQCPEETTDLLFTILSASKNETADLTQLLSSFLDILAQSSEFIQFVLRKLPPAKATPIIDRILELRLRKLENINDVSDSELTELFALADTATPAVALELVRIFRCQPIEHRIMQKDQRWKELAQFLLKHGELRELIQICKSQGGTELWLQALSCVAQRTDLSDADIRGFLSEIEQAEALHPLLVLEVLSSSETLKISAIKGYVINWLQRQNAQIERDTKSVEASEKRMEEMSRQLESLKFEPQVIQVNKCCACDMALQLPAVHFLCKHSFHVHCFESYSEQPDHCPACTTATEMNNAETIDTQQKAVYGKFQNQMNSSINGMEILAKYLGMGIFDNKPAARHSIDHKSGEQRSGDALSDRNPFQEAPKRRPTNPFSTPSSTSTNPFETTSTNAFETPAAAKNPFEEGVTKSTNPFDEPVSKAKKTKPPQGKNPFDE